MYLGIEIGGTKLQWIVGNGRDTTWLDRRITAVDRSRQADGIRDQLIEVTREFMEAYPQIERIGIGFGGPVDSVHGRVITSHQIDGWRDFPLTEWMAARFGRPAILANDSDCAGLAEAVYGAGRGAANVFYSNVGSGIGGAFIIRGQLYTGGSGIASEIGHLRPIPVDEASSEPSMCSAHSVCSSRSSDSSHSAYCSDSSDFSQANQNIPDVEAMASGWAITEYVRARCLASPRAAQALEILDSIGGSLDLLDTRAVVRCALERRNPIAMAAMARCTRVYGWAIAQMITLLSPEVVVIGGGVSLADSSLFLTPLRERVSQNVFPALRDTYRLVLATLGEEVVAAGAIAIAATDV